ncbi:MAG: hypothetical protein QOD29_1085, partial [Alphaproteobacteria bacterium]|nr:hypothetical protein [Alphaproteobacteria bacterium]
MRSRPTIRARRAHAVGPFAPAVGDYWIPGSLATLGPQNDESISESQHYTRCSKL